MCPAPGTMAARMRGGMGHVGGDRGVLLVELPGDSERRRFELCQLSPERWLTPRSHTPQRFRQLPRSLRIRASMVSRSNTWRCASDEERLPVPVAQEAREVACLQLRRLLVRAAARPRLRRVLDPRRGGFQKERGAPLRVAQREVEREAPSHRVAGNRWTASAKTVEQIQERPCGSSRPAAARARNRAPVDRGKHGRNAHRARLGPPSWRQSP